MGTVTESFSNLSEYLLAERKTAKRRGFGADLIISHLLKPMMPSAVRIGSGTITDIKDRQVGPFDVVAGIDAFPTFSEGTASTCLAGGVIFALQVRNWAENDLSQFGEMARLLKKTEGKRKNPIPCFAVSFEPLLLAEVSQFLRSKAGDSVDGILCLGHHVILRNSQGWYGDPARIPFVTERPGPEALKSFTFFLLHLAQIALGQPFGLSDYQHL
jgi:hypothetical protein